MSPSTLNFLNSIFVQAPGDFLYFLIVMSISLVSLVFAFQVREDAQHQWRRYRVSMAGVLFVWSLLLVGVIFTQISGQQSETILPPLERAVAIASFILIGWSFITADHVQWKRSANITLVLLLAIITIGYTVTGVSWINAASFTDFNLSQYGIAWTFIGLSMSIIGLVVLFFLFRHILDAPLKLVFFVLLALSYGLTIFQTTNGSLIGNYAGIARLGFAITLVIVPIIIYRLVQWQTSQLILELKTQQQSIQQLPDRPTPTRQEREVPAKLASADMQSVQLLKSIGMILEGSNPSDIPTLVVRTALDLLRADIGALLRLQDANYADITQSFDRVMQRYPAGMALNLDNQPTLVNAIERQDQRALYPDRNVEELDDLFSRLDVEQTGPVYFQPLVHKRELVAILLVGLPYANRELRRDEVELLKGFGFVAGSLLAVSYAAHEATILAEDRVIQAMVEGVAPSEVNENASVLARQELQENLKNAKDQIANLSRQVTSLKIELDDERTRITSLLGSTESGSSISQRIVAINEEQERLREERDRLAKRLQEAEAALTGATSSGNDSAINNLLETVSKEKEKLEQEKERLQHQLDDFRARDKSVAPEDVQRLLNRMMEEKARLESERNQLQDNLSGIENQLQSLGIEDDTIGLTEMISRLYQERADLQEQNNLLQQERNMLLRQREKLADNMGAERDREAQLQLLKQEVENLASDREIAIRQRDKYRQERDEFSEKLQAVKEHRARLLAQTSGFEIELSEARDEHVKLRAQIQELADSRSELTHTRDRLSAEIQALQTQVNQLMAQIQGDPSRLQQVSEEGAGSFRRMIEELSQERDRLERELNDALNRLANSESRDGDNVTRAPSNGVTAIYHPQQPELLVGLVQELRTPMTSIGGYVDLLLGESAGILGEMQRKFLQRVATNITRLDTMIDSLVSVTELDTGNYRLQPRPIDIVSIVEEAITNASIQFREKGLAVSLDLDDDIPLMKADKDSMSQIIGQLLTNAYLVSPPDSEITVTVSRRLVALYDSSPPESSLFVAIEDRGGGILLEDIPRVFARKYKAENPLIQGLGDTGVGMSIAKALVEAHHGKLWVETKSGMGSIFQFAIPLEIAEED